MNLRAILLLLAAYSLHAADLSGEWLLATTYLGTTDYARMTLKADGGKLSGNINELSLQGAVTGDQVKLSAKRPNGKHFGDFQGKLQDDTLAGNANFPGREIAWTARRAIKAPTEARVHDFEPKEFHRVFSDAIPPVLHLFPGDTVRTFTVDAGGFDSKGVRRSQGGNPETGPFYVEGAIPGDTLVVQLKRVRLNRDTAMSGDQIVGSALTPNYLRNTKYKEDFDTDWVLDREKGIARLKKPTTRLKNYTVKLQPMMGCIAVAPPAHQSLRTGFLGSFGGNMDYNQMREGTTLYLPVYAPGALLFIGDGHAAQGDGELAGDALETSMDVEFIVDLVKGKSTQGPRAENAEFLMAMGIANSLQDALQVATTQLANWLQQDYKLDPNEAAIILNTAMRYDIAEVVDPLVHVVAKLRKDILTPLK